jgi:hypothetical protein
MELIQKLNYNLSNMLSYLDIDDILGLCKTIKYLKIIYFVYHKVHIDYQTKFIVLLGRRHVRNIFIYYQYNACAQIDYFNLLPKINKQQLIIDIPSKEAAILLELLPKHIIATNVESAYTDSIYTDMELTNVCNILKHYDNYDNIVYEVLQLHYIEEQHPLIHMFSLKDQAIISMKLYAYNIEYSLYDEDIQYQALIISHYSIDIIIYVYNLNELCNYTIIALYHHITITDYALLLLYITNTNRIYKHLPCDAIDEIKQIQKVLLTNFRNQFVN